jgi:hypothetical protein
VEIPIACSLGEEGVSQRLTEWKVALAESAASTSRPSRDRVVFMLHSDPSALEALLRLSILEKRCCPFLTFEFEVTTEGVAMAIGAPSEAVSILDGFASLTAPESPTATGERGVL